MPAPVSDYRYIEADPCCNHAYLEPLVLRVLRAAGARTVFDLGCGNGALVRGLTKAGFAVVGCDLSESGIRIAREADPAGEYHVLGAGEDPAGALGGRQFDAVVSCEVIEHLALPRAIPRFAHQLLAPGGSLVVTTPYHGYLKNLAICIAGKWDFHHTTLWDAGHVRFFSRATLGALMREEGFVEKTFLGAGRIRSLWKSMVVEFVRPPLASV